MKLFRRSRQQDRIIDLAAMERARSATPAVQWGLPTPCPECGGPGYLDRIDPVRELMTQHCPSCFHKWETSKAEAEPSARSEASA